MIGRGDRIDVALDVLVEPDAYRVRVFGVFAPGQAPQAGPEGTRRNVVQTWLGTHHDVPAFALERDGALVGKLLDLVPDLDRFRPYRVPGLDCPICLVDTGDSAHFVGCVIGERLGCATREGK